jgi:adenylate cyclase
MDMRERLYRLNVNLKQKGLPQLSIGVVLHTGDLLIGAIGSTRRLDYTVIGDTVKGIWGTGDSTSKLNPVNFVV